MVAKYFGKKYSKSKKGDERPDFILLLCFFVLITFGIIMLASAGAPLGFRRFGDNYYFLKRQILFGLIPGLCAAYAMYKIPYTFWKKTATGMLIVSIILLMSVFIPGIGADFGTAKSWIQLGGFSFQPSELVKLTFLIYLATWLENRGVENIKDFSKGFMPFVMTLGVIMFLMIMQPDVGTMMIIVLQTLVVFFVAGGSIMHLTMLGGFGVMLLYVLIKIAPYRAARLTVLFDPELDPLGIGYHINQAFLAIGSGGWFGRGYGQSRQKFQYLPEVLGDSIFAVISEEMGFLISAGVVCLLLYIFIRTLLLSQYVKDSYGKLLMIGIVSWLIIQAFVNIGAMVGILPLTGVPLPFISSGGSALLVSMAAIGLLLNITKYAEK